MNNSAGYDLITLGSLFFPVTDCQLLIRFEPELKVSEA
jgi:hypothetical protein